MPSLADFINQYLPFAQSASASTGLPADFILGQAGLESGYGTSRLAKDQNNFFGIGGPGNFKSYASPADGFAAYAAMINRRYDTSSFGGMNPTQMAGSLAGQGYTPDAGYAASVGSSTAQIDKVLQSLGLGGLAGGSATPGAASSSTPSSATPAGHSGILGPFEDWLANISGSLLFVVLGVTILIAAMFMFAKQSGAFDNLPNVVPIPV